MFREILFDNDARSKIIKGLNITSRAVGSTLGPRGTNVIFEDSSFPTITKDGVTVAQQIFLEDKFENMGVMMAREAAQNTNREAGDGTTTTVVLLNSMVNEANKYITAGMNPILIKRGIDYAKDLVLKELEKQVIKVNDPDTKRNIAIISANNDVKLGTLIAEVIDSTGTDGIVTVQTTGGLDINVEYIKGMRITSGYESHVFINNQKRLACNLEEPAVIITTDQLSSQEQLIPLIESVIKSGKHSMVLFATAIEGAALALLVQNYMMGKFTCVPVKFSSFGDYKRDLLYDLAALTNTTVLGSEEAVKLRDGKAEHCGTCNAVIITKDNTIISGGDGDVNGRIEEVKALLEDEKDIYRIDKLKDRLGRLTGSIANIKVGGSSETEQNEIKYRIEDALNATKSAIEEGIVVGAGTALLNCYKTLEIESTGVKEMDAGIEIVRNSLLIPLKTIVNNGGGNGEAVVGKVLDSGLGYDALNDKYCDLIENGIIDPFKVVKNEVINATSTAGTMITANTAISIKSEKK